MVYWHGAKRGCRRTDVMMQERKDGAPHRKERTNNIQKTLFRTQFVLIISLAVFLGVAGMLINLSFENEKRDQNLKNIAETIARSPILTQTSASDAAVLQDYLDPLKDALGDIDVISVVDENRQRIYHSNHALIGTGYDGNMPEFDRYTDGYYTVDENGPSGSQRRAYAAVYNTEGKFSGFVMAIMLMKNIKTENLQMLFVFLMITVVAILIEIIIAGELSGRVKRSLLGYEPDVFTAMYKMRDNILEALEEGILAVDGEGVVQFANAAAVKMLDKANEADIVGKKIDSAADGILTSALLEGDREFNIHLQGADVLFDRVPIREDDRSKGIVAILHNRAEYTKLMEDLTGTRYLVDSMRANNHDFTNKLHVILGLIQMEMYEEATKYIQNITLVQRENISKVMKAVGDPAIAALLIGKIARASELNIGFVLREGCRYVPSDCTLPSEILITVIGNLLDNAFEAMNDANDFESSNELMFGIYSRPGALLITVDDTGLGISKENLERVFENGFSTKGEGRGTGLYQVKSLVESLNGEIRVESQEGAGTSFLVSFTNGRRK